MTVPRPLTGEPLGIDLLNTTWCQGGQVNDLLADLTGTRAWLDEVDVACPATEQARTALLVARDAIRAHAEHPRSGSTRAALNAVLRWGSSWPILGAQGVELGSATEDPAALAGWLAAANYAELFGATPDRIRRCAHPDCILYFLDTSARGSRRWCSMTVCGNRAKAARHYARVRSS
jgi:predicted RNA-binding Zn ribbon-like protein